MQSHIFRALSRFPAFFSENRKKYSNEAKKCVREVEAVFLFPPFPTIVNDEDAETQHKRTEEGEGGRRKRVIMLPAERGKIVSGSLEGGNKGGRGHFEGGRFLPRHSSFH